MPHLCIFLGIVAWPCSLSALSTCDLQEDHRTRRLAKKLGLEAPALPTMCLCVHNVSNSNLPIAYWTFKTPRSVSVLSGEVVDVDDYRKAFDKFDTDKSGH